MVNLRKYKLGEFLEIEMGQSPNGSTCNKSNSGIPLLNGPTEFGDRFPRAVQYTTDPKRISQKGDILFCVRGSTTGRMNYSDKKYAIGRGLAAIRHKQGKKLQPFVKGLIDIILPSMLQQVTGSTFPNLSKDQLNNYQVEIPADLPTQTRIAFILSSLDDKIELNRRMNQTLEQMAQALFNHYFVDNIDKDNLPEGWRMGKIGEICFVQNGYAFKSKDFANEGSIGIIKIKNINNNIVDINSTQFINEIVLNALDRKFKVNSEDVLIAMTGAEVGKIGIVPNNSKSLWLNQRVGNIKERNSYGKFFTYILLTSNNYQNELETTAMGSAQPNISASDIENIKLIIPKEQEICNFEIAVTAMFHKICQNLEEISILVSIRDTLLPKLMSGEIDVDKIMDEEELIENELADCKTE